MGELMVGVPARAEEVGELERRANRGDKQALVKLVKHYDEHPELWMEVGDMASHIVLTTISSMVGNSLALRECLLRRVRKIKEEAAGANPSPLEVLLAERVAVCWIQLQHAEAVLSNNGSIAQADFWQRRLDRAHRRFLSAVKALAVIRRLQLPAVQVNIGDKQVNVVAQGRKPPVLDAASVDETQVSRDEQPI